MATPLPQLECVLARVQSLALKDVLKAASPTRLFLLSRPEHPWGLPVKIRAKDPDENRGFIQGGCYCTSWVRSLGLEPTPQLSTYEALLIKFFEIIIDSHEVVE